MRAITPTLLLPFFYVAAVAASTAVLAVGTYENIKNEGIACLELAASIGGLQTLVGTSYMQKGMRACGRP